MSLPSSSFSSQLTELKQFLSKRFQERRKWVSTTGEENYRLFNFERNLPLAIDIYATKYVHAVVHETSHMPSLEEIGIMIQQATGLDKEHIYVKLRPKLTNKEHYTPVNNVHRTYWVEENGLYLQVNLSDYLDTGLFLDQRIARRTIMELSLQKDVLNLFCYTGSFSLFAAAGGAHSVHSIDISRTYLTWAEENFKYNHILSPHYTFSQQDVLAYLQHDDGEKYHIIILDPPIFSNSRKMSRVLNIKRDYSSLINACLKKLHPEGFIFFSTPLTTLKVQEGHINGILEEVTRKTISLDFSGLIPHRSWMIYPAVKQKKIKNCPKNENTNVDYLIQIE